MLKVTKGSGMGMIHSGSVSDLAFLKLAEIPLLCRRDELGIQLYTRYRDDIFVVLDHPRRCPAFYEALITTAAKVYKIERESYSLVGSSMLDLFIFKLESTTGVSLAWKPFVKPTAVHVPLHSSSIHPRSTHTSWPVAEIARMYRRSLFVKDFTVAKTRMISRFRRFFLEAETF